LQEPAAAEIAAASPCVVKASCELVFEGVSGQLLTGLLILHLAVILCFAITRFKSYACL
jgi:hypothetical protein